MSQDPMDVDGAMRKIQESLLSFENPATGRPSSRVAEVTPGFITALNGATRLLTRSSSGAVPVTAPRIPWNTVGSPNGVRYTGAGRFRPARMSETSSSVVCVVASMLPRASDVPSFDATSRRAMSSARLLKSAYSSGFICVMSVKPARFASRMKYRLESVFSSWSGLMPNAPVARWSGTMRSLSSG